MVNVFLNGETTVLLLTSQSDRIVLELALRDFVKKQLHDRVLMEDLELGFKTDRRLSIAQDMFAALRDGSPLVDDECV